MVTNPGRWTRGSPGCARPSFVGSPPSWRVTDRATPVSVLVPAVGGQGGGVLPSGSWRPRSSTDIPSTARRSRRGAAHGLDDVLRGDPPTAARRRTRAPIFSLYPVPGALDVLLAPEFLEVGRSIELGFPSPGRTTIIASTHRLYSIHEKIATGSGIYPIEELAAAAQAFSRRLIAFDALALAREHGTEANAGPARSAGGPAPAAPGGGVSGGYRAKGVQVEANLRGFEAGSRGAGARRRRRASEGSRGFEPRTRRSGPRPRLAAAGRRSSAWRWLSEAAAGGAASAVARLVDYQDRAYAERGISSGYAVRARGGSRARSDRGTSSGGLDDLRGRGPCRPAQDPVQPIRSAFVGTERRRRRDRGDGLPQAGPRRDLRRPARIDWSRRSRAGPSAGGRSVGRRSAST